MELTHKLLCDLAVGWLKRPSGDRRGPSCKIAFSESRGDWKSEMPDAIGFRVGVYHESSTLVEVKMSRADFLADRKKPHRIEPASGMGIYRYFMAPVGLISVDELPARWGLIEVTEKGVLKVRCGHVLVGHQDHDAWRHERSVSKEWSLLGAMLNRVGDVEKAQNYLKEANNLNSRLAKSNDALRSKNEQLSRDLYLAQRGETVGSMAGVRAKRKLAAPEHAAPAPIADDALSL